MRQLCSAGDAAAVFFVLPADSDDVDAHHADMLRLPIAAQGRRTSGKFLLQNAFYRAAVASLPSSVSYVARMDDDALVNASDIAAQLALVEAWREPDEMVVYGPFQNWYLWHRESMQATCWDFGFERWWKALTNWRHDLSRGEGRSARGRRNASQPLEPAHGTGPNQCVRPGQVGPFPFAAGPFIAHSARLLAAIVGLPQLDRDEARPP